MDLPEDGNHQSVKAEPQRRKLYGAKSHTVATDHAVNHGVSPNTQSHEASKLLECAEMDAAHALVE